MYRIVIENRAGNEIKSLPDDIIQRVIDAIRALESNPRPHGTKKLIGGDGWRVKIRTYRILYTIDDKQRLISVYRVKHRKDVYR